LTHLEILQELKKGIYKPIYFLAGDEPYFIDLVSDYIEKNALQEHEKDFNQSILYGRDTNILELISNAKRFPMMAEKQVVIVKEAQDLKEIDKLDQYLDAPLSSTILVLCYKGKKPDGRSAFGKKVVKQTVYLLSEKLRDYQVPKFIEQYCKDQGYKINEKSSFMLTEFLGADLAKVVNELEKLYILLPKGSEITPTIIEKNIGISKDFNVFELQDAIGKKNVFKAVQIIDYFGKNTKQHNIIPTLSSLHSYFTKIMKMHYSKNKNNNKELAKELGVHEFFIKDYATAAKNYKPGKLVEIAGLLLEYDLKAKGVNNISADEAELQKELIMRILN
jgi:DNA polymerase III subunit delta